MGARQAPASLAKNNTARTRSGICSTAVGGLYSAAFVRRVDKWAKVTMELLRFLKQPSTPIPPRHLAHDYSITHGLTCDEYRAAVAHRPASSMNLGVK